MSQNEHWRRMKAAGRQLAKDGDFDDMNTNEVVAVMLDALNTLYARFPTDRQEHHDVSEALELIDYLPNVLDEDGDLYDPDDEDDE